MSDVSEAVSIIRDYVRRFRGYFHHQGLCQTFQRLFPSSGTMSDVFETVSIIREYVRRFRGCFHHEGLCQTFLRLFPSSGTMSDVFEAISIIRDYVRRFGDSFHHQGLCQTFPRLFPSSGTMSDVSEAVSIIRDYVRLFPSSGTMSGCFHHQGLRRFRECFHIRDWARRFADYLSLHNWLISWYVVLRDKVTAIHSAAQDLPVLQSEVPYGGHKSLTWEDYTWCTHL
jgi:hypothetical protein